LDQEILKLLCKDGRISLIEMSKKLKKSPKVIAYRIKILERKKLIEGYRPNIDYNKIGYIYYKIFINLNNASKKQKNLLKEYIKKNPLLIYVVEGISLHADIDIEMMLESNQELFDFIEDLRLKFPEIVGEYQTIVFAENLKTKYLPF
jgi:Lrp/AsnC family transcriptional regulator for asnA, asnC and gidA